jgi:polyphosphate kinase
MAAATGRQGDPAKPRKRSGRTRTTRAATSAKSQVRAELDRDIPSTVQADVPDPPRPDDPPMAMPLPEDRYLNRELSWLDFNARVLTLAEDDATPLMERAKFLAIFANNLDEFYMVRVAGLKRRLSTGLPVEGPDRLTPREQLAMIAERTTELMDRHAACFANDVEPAIAKQQVQLLRWVDLDAADQERLRSYFRDQIFPVLTPLAVDPAHPFPYISGLSLNLAVVVRDPDSGPELFARIKVPNNVPRFVSVNAPGRAGVMIAGPDGGPAWPASCRWRSSSRRISASCSPACRSSSTTCSG